MSSSVALAGSGSVGMKPWALALIVGLANIINDRARLSEATNPSPPSEVVAKQGQGAKADPLADAGVVPDLPAENEPEVLDLPPAEPGPDDGT